MSEARITPRVAAVLLRHLDARRLRVAYRADAEVYAVLVALAECAIADESSCDSETIIAIGNGTGNDCRMTVLQAARRAGVSAQAIIKAIHDNRLEADRFGPVWQISERSLARYMAARDRQERQAS
jgi:excisionase family DNA binding protein